MDIVFTDINENVKGINIFISPRHGDVFFEFSKTKRDKTKREKMSLDFGVNFSPLESEVCEEQMLPIRHKKSNKYQKCF